MRRKSNCDIKNAPPSSVTDELRRGKCDKNKELFRPGENRVTDDIICFRCARNRNDTDFEP